MPKGIPLNLDLIPESTLRLLYEDNGLSCHDIGETFGLTIWAIIRMLNHCGIKLHDIHERANTPRTREKMRLGALLRSHSHKKLTITRDEFLYLYVTLQKNDAEIGRMYCVDRSNVTRARQKLGIPTRLMNKKARTRALRRALMLGQHRLRGYKHSEEERQRQSERTKQLFRDKPILRLKGSLAKMGPLNPNWSGGVTSCPYPYQFDERLKDQIRQRDNHICQLCGLPQKKAKRKLPIHHIDYDKCNLVDANLISLCNGCNVRVNANRGYWTVYFQSKLQGHLALRPVRVLAY